MTPDKSDLINIRIARANECLSEVDVLIENDFWNTSVNRLYYACFYAASALLINDDIITKTHAGTRQMFGLHYVKSGKMTEEHGELYTTLFHMRQSADYEDMIDYEKDDVVILIEPVKEFVVQTGKILSQRQ
jgi:uncharacterized protein (UPF0332 family)